MAPDDPGSDPQSLDRPAKALRADGRESRNHGAGEATAQLRVERNAVAAGVEIARGSTPSLR
jgi:hypothetical protein